MLILLCPPETTLQAETLWLGNSDSTLTPEGRLLAEDLARHHSMHNARVFVAPSQHVREFAMILFKVVNVIAEFSDRSMGSLTGRSYRETLAEFPRRNWLAWQRSYWNAPPDGESLFDISDRVLTAFRTRVLPIPAGETVVIIAAADVLRILIGSLSNMEETSIPKIQIEPIMPYTINGDL